MVPGIAVRSRLPAAAACAVALLALPSDAAAQRLRAAGQPTGTIVLGPATLATSSTTTLQNHPTCGSQGCTFIQWSGSAADASYASPVNGTIVAWRIASGSAANKVKLRVLRPAGGRQVLGRSLERDRDDERRRG